jgi:hypothetical protein
VPPQLSFEVVPVGHSTTKQLSITNVSSHTLQVSFLMKFNQINSIQICTEPLSNNFTLVNALREIRPGHTHTVFIKFKPDKEEEVSLVT